MSKINFFKIFKDHINTLVDYDPRKPSLMDFLLFYIFPLEASLFLSLHVHFKTLFDISSDLMVFYGGSAGFLLNVLVLIYGYDVSKFKNPTIVQQVLKETSSNIAYLITMAALSMVMLFIVKLSKADDFMFFCKTYLNTFYLTVFKNLFVIFISFSLINFFLTMLMILKRFYSIDGNRVF